MKMGAFKINWDGSQLGNHSLAIVNRNICKYLQQDKQINLRKKISETEQLLNSHLKENPDFLPFYKPDLTVSHQWPPNWVKPNCGKWICMQPWEYGAIPREWYIPMKYWVDEIWVNSTYTKEGYIRSGIPEDKIYVLPLGVDENVFHQNVEALTVEPVSFRFLFVGGTIGRKGIDILIQAYLNEFRADEDVCLFIKDIGTQSFYKGITLEKIIHEAMSDSKNPRIIYLDKHFSEGELAGLYKACDCLVHPYRGEGFGLPIAEAMACGIPVIVPNNGSCLDFCSDETALFVPSNEVTLPEKKVSNLETVDFPWWLSIEPKELQQVMRFAFENRTLVKEKGKKASQQILSSFTWEKSAQHVSNRIKQLVRKKSFSKPTDEDIVNMELIRANELYAANLIEDSLGAYLNILTIYPSSLMARYNAAIIFLGKKNYILALDHLEYIANNMEKQNKEFQEKIILLVKFCRSQKIE